RIVTRTVRRAAAAVTDLDRRFSERRSGAAELRARGAHVALSARFEILDRALGLAVARIGRPRQPDAAFAGAQLRRPGRAAVGETYDLVERRHDLRAFVEPQREAGAE